jgi:putative DNA primase/helicase
MPSFMRFSLTAAGTTIPGSVTENWLSFLNQLWPNDPESQGTLQEWMGYLLTPRTHLQKILMIVGPPRSGKGTIARVIRMLLGHRNICAPTLSGLTTHFGLANLIGKSLAIIADARIGGRTDTTAVTERLLSIGGEDTISVPRKFLPDWDDKLPNRFIILTNELPCIEDASGAFASRFNTLRPIRSFEGEEDPLLIEKFIPELPGILLWALEGWDCLNQCGRLTQPESAADLRQQFADLGSPIGTFLRGCCEIGSGFQVLQHRMFEVWKSWCDDNGRDWPGTVQVFGRNLRAAVPGLGTRQPRVGGRRRRYYEGIRLRRGF